MLWACYKRKDAGFEPCTGIVSCLMSGTGTVLRVGAFPLCFSPLPHSQLPHVRCHSPTPFIRFGCLVLGSSIQSAFSIGQRC